MVTVGSLPLFSNAGFELLPRVIIYLNEEK